MSIEIQSQRKFEVYIKLFFSFYNLVSLSASPFSLRFLATFRSFTWSAGVIFYT